MGAVGRAWRRVKKHVVDRMCTRRSQRRMFNRSVSSQCTFVSEYTDHIATCIVCVNGQVLLSTDWSRGLCSGFRMYIGSH